MNEKKHKPLKVCHLVESAGSGTLSVIMDSINTLTESKHNTQFEFTIVYSGGRAETPKDLRDMLPMCQFIDFPMGSKAFSLGDFKAITQLKKVLKSFDVIHMHSSRAGFLGRLSLMFTAKKSTPLSFYSPHCYGFLNLGFSPIKRSIVYTVEWLLAKLTKTRTIACGETEHQTALKLDPKALLVQNGFDPRKINLNENNLLTTDDKVIILSSGRDCLQKGPDHFKEIMSNCSASNLSFVWIGNTEFEGVSTGWLSREKALETVSKSNIYLATSLWEGLPVSGIEAMFFKKPLLVRNSSSFVDLVDHGINGYIFNTTDEATKFINILRNDRELREKMGNASYLKASQEFHVSNYKKLANAYLNQLE